MKRGFSAWLGVLALFALGGAGVWTLHGAREITLTQARVQELVDEERGKELALRGAARALVRGLRMRSATVRLGAGRAAIDFEIDGVAANGKSFSVAAATVGAPRYDDGRFFFAPETVQIRDVAYADSRPLEIIARLGETLGDGAVKRAIEARGRRAEEWVRSVVENAAEALLARRPIYAVKDDARGKILKFSLESMRVEEGRVVLAFSFWSMTLAAALGGLAWIAAIGGGWLLLRRARRAD